MIDIGDNPASHEDAVAVLEHLCEQLTTTPETWTQGRAVGRADNGVRSACASQLLSDTAVAHPGLCTWLHHVAHTELCERAASAAGLDPWDLDRDLTVAQNTVATAAKTAGQPRPTFGLPSWNDEPGRVVGEVAELFDACKHRITHTQ